MTTPSPDWPALVRAKRAEVESKIPQEWRLPESTLKDLGPGSNARVIDVPRDSGILSHREIEITETYDATDLVALMAGEKLSAVEVVTAFCKRAALAHQLTNCLTEPMFQEAIEQAKALDTHLATKGAPIGPLHGLPISLKDMLGTKGHVVTIGYIALLASPPVEHDAAIVTILKRLGAIPIAKTNVPQTMMAIETDNNVMGRTLNPHRLNLSTGGSSGGEGALLALRGAALGVGTDIGGSIRIPSIFNGLVSVRPTTHRVPLAGRVPPGRAGSPGPIFGVAGPMGHSIRDMELFFRSVISSEPWLVDPEVLNIPWRLPTSPRAKLRLGLILEEKSKRPLHPPLLKTMTRLQSALEEKGHTIISLDDKIPSLYSLAILASKMFGYDPQRTPVKIMQRGNDPLMECVRKTFLPETAGWEGSLDELWNLNVEQMSIVRLFHGLVVENDLDGILMPGYQGTSAPHDECGVPLYTLPWNMIDWPVVTIPYLTASEVEDKEFIRSDCVYIPPYDPKTFENMPSGFQLIGRPHREEELLQVAQRVQEDISHSPRPNI